MRASARSLLVLAFLALVPAASAGGPSPGEMQLVAFAPVVVEPNGSATLDGDGMVLVRGAGEIAAFALHADRLTVTIDRERAECLSFAGIERCVPVPGSAEREVLELADATMRAKGELAEAFEAVITLRSDHLDAHADAAEGSLTLTHDARPAELDVASRRVVAPAGAGSDALGAPAEGRRSFAPREDDFLLAAHDATLAADGRLGVFLSGVAVHLVGTDAQGQLVDRVIVTGASRAEAPYGGTDSLELLYAEAAGSRLDAHLSGEALLLGRPTVRALDGITVLAALGTLEPDGETRRIEGNERIRGDATFRPVSFRIDGDEEAWIVLESAQASTAAATTRGAQGPSLATALATGAIAGAAAGALASLLVAGAWRWNDLRYAASPLLAALYSRIARDEVLDHRHREAILRAVREAPGVTPKELARASGLAWTTVAHHLRRLESSALVVMRRDGRRMRFYAAEAAPADLHAAYAALRNPTSARFAELVRKHPAIAQKDAAEALGLSPSLLAWHATRLEAAGVVLKTKERGRARYHAGPAMLKIGTRTA